MIKGQQDRSMQGKLSEHGAFAPMLGIWGAALGGLCVLALPSRLIAQLSEGTGIMLLGPQAQVVLAGGAAVLLGGALFAVAHGGLRKARRKADAQSLVSLASRHVRAIDPKRELGSASLDEPLVTMPFAAAAAVTDIAVPKDTATDVGTGAVEGAILAAAPEPADPWADMPPPLALDLAQFSELPGRNAVWVDGAAGAAPIAVPALSNAHTPAPTGQPVTLVAVPETPAPQPAASPSTAALAHLRAQPPEELSMAQMVERFAGALHEHRTGTAGKSPSGRDLAAREAALAEALKALAVLSGIDPATPRDEPLRDALARLQGLRGAA